MALQSPRHSLVSFPTGVVTTLAVAAHEIPQEIGDFGLLLKRGMTRKNVILANVLSASGNNRLGHDHSF
jgi:zinc transporter ZupT